jgi:ferric-dicitrate binding protein FerR (iron transport regulator)
MTNNRTDFSGEIAAAAASWAERFVLGMSESEKTEFKTWLAADPQHPRALAQANRNRVDCDWAWQAGVADEVVARLDERARRRHRRRRQALAGAAEVVPESWTGRFFNPESETRSLCPRNDVSTVPI